MLDKLKGVLSTAVTKVGNKFSIMQLPIMWIVASYMILLILLILSYYFAWLYRSTHGEIVLNDLLLIIKEVTGTSMIAVITFICGCFVDLDGNGIPDQFENDKK